MRSSSATTRAPANWLCLGAAIDTTARRYGVGFEAYGSNVGNGGIDHAIVMGDLDTGEIAWQGFLPAQPRLPPLSVAMVPQTFPRPIYPRGITLTTTGLIVTGHYGCSAAGNALCVAEEGFVGWFTLDGQFRGLASAAGGTVEPDPEAPTSRSRAVSQYALASGPIAAVGLGTDVVVINPEAATPVLRAPLAGVEPTSRSTYWFSGAWTNALILLPMLSSITALDPVALVSEWTYTEGLEWRIVDSITTSGGETDVLLTNAGQDEFRLVVLETATGDVLRRIPIPAHVEEDDRPNGWYAQMTPLGREGIVIADFYGRLIFLGPADESRLPSVTLSDRYPAPGTEFDLSVDAPGAQGVLVGWGDGSEESLPPSGSTRHLFADRGPRDVSLTSVFSDGTTATRSFVIDVGGSPPRELTALQKAFSPENQEITFFLLGTLITVVGLAVTVGRHRRRFAKLERELAAIEELRILSVADPRAAALELKAYRDRLPADLARRRIDDSQYQILDLRSARLLRVLRTRMFSPYDARLSARYHRLLDAAFEDAILQPSERSALMAALEEEALDPSQKAAIGAILDDLTTQRPGG